MVTLWTPSKHIHIEILGGRLDGQWIDSKRSTPLEGHLMAMLEDMAVGQELHVTKLRDVIDSVRTRTAPPPAPLAEKYTVVTREETGSELLLQLRLSYLRKPK